MLILTITVDGSFVDPIGAKERICMALEREGYTDMRVISVVEKLPQQIEIDG